MNKKSKIEFRNLIKSLATDFIYDVSSANEYLQDNGIDPDEVATEGREFIESLKRKKRLELSLQKKNRLVKLREFFLYKVNSVTDSNIKELAGFLSNGDKLAFEHYYNKLTKATSGDIEQINDEQKFLAWLEEESESDN